MAIQALASASVILQQEDPPQAPAFPVEGCHPSTYLQAAIKVPTVLVYCILSALLCSALLCPALPCSTLLFCTSVKHGRYTLYRCHLATFMPCCCLVCAPGRSPSALNLQHFLEPDSWQSEFCSAALVMEKYADKHFICNGRPQQIAGKRPAASGADRRRMDAQGMPC